MAELTIKIMLAASFLVPVYIFYRDNDVGIIGAIIWCFLSLAFTYLIRLIIRHNSSLKKVVKLIISDIDTTIYYVTYNSEVKEVVIQNDKTKLELYEVNGPRIRHRRIIFYSKKESYYCLDHSGLWDQDNEVENMFSKIKGRYRKVEHNVYQG